MSIADNIRVPFTYIEFDSSKATRNLAALQPYQILLIGQKFKEGEQPPMEPIRVTNPAQAGKYFGSGSMLHSMFKVLYQNNRQTESWAIALDDDPSAQQARGAIEFTGEAQHNGVIYLFLAARCYRAPVFQGEGADKFLPRIIDLITNDIEREIDAHPTEGKPNVLSLFSRHKGEVGNSLDISLNYEEQQSLPDGIKAVITPMAGGSINPDLKKLGLSMGDHPFCVIGFAYSDNQSLTALDLVLEDRWGAIRQIDGHAFCSSSLPFARLATTFSVHNSKQYSVMAITGSPSPSYQWSAAVAAVNAASAAIDPARPFQTLELLGLLAPKRPLSFEERNLLLLDGLSTFTSDEAGKIRIERLLTTYKKNEAGAEDVSYLDVNTKQTLSYLRYDFRNHFLKKFPRHKLASDGTRFAAGQPVLTPNTAKAEAIAKFRGWELLGLVEGADQFIKELVVERNAKSPNRLDFILSPDLMNQLLINAVQISFIL